MSVQTSAVAANNLRVHSRALQNYFKINPYQNWFGVKNLSKKGFLPVLNGLDTCYYEDIKQNTEEIQREHILNTYINFLLNKYTYYTK